MRVNRCVVVVASCLGCSSPSPPEARPSTAGDAKVIEVPFRSSIDARRWLAGDVHMHVAPPDDPADVKLNVSQIAAAARDAKLDFLVLTPHVWPARRGAAFDREWQAMAREARATKVPALIPGVEWTTGGGHFTVAGVDVTKLGTDFLASADASGAFLSVNHPFAVPTKLPAVRASHFDMSYRAWTGTAAAAPIDAVEVWNLPLALANLISRPGGRTGEERAWSAADRLAREQRRRITAVGGSDNHQLVIVATTWVLALEATETAILEALRAGATCVGGPEAGSFRARGDEGWVRIGGIITAAHTAHLVWDGLARLFVDGVDRGEHAGGFVHPTDGVQHTYRIVVGASRSGFIYANL
jgi:hypothetical protein